MSAHQIMSADEMRGALVRPVMSFRLAMTAAGTIAAMTAARTIAAIGYRSAWR